MFLDKLKEYKELITIMIFFIGGFVWLDEKFPTKDDLKAEVASLSCLLEKYMTLTQLQVRNQELEKKNLSLGKQISEKPPEDAGPSIMLEFEQLKSDYESNRKEIRDNASEMKNIQNDLARNICGKVSS